MSIIVNKKYTLTQGAPVQPAPPEIPLTIQGQTSISIKGTFVGGEIVNINMGAKQESLSVEEQVTEPTNYRAEWLGDVQFEVLNAQAGTSIEVNVTSNNL